MIEHALSLEPGNEVDAAIARVLAAERAAEQDLALARDEALAIAEKARSAVRNLEERTERRIRAVRTAFAEATDRELAAMARASADAHLGSPISSADDQRVDDAVAKVAAVLTGERA